MELFFAKFIGIYLLVVGLAVLFRPDRFRGLYHDFFASAGLMALGGIMALLLGALIVSLHNVWVLGWPVLITIFGWWAVIKGAVLLIHPDLFNGFLAIANWSNRAYRVMGIVSLGLGIYLSYVGWWMT